jgi:arabinogalactan oligomer/maltooligosaccharide transport system substrate-binding protein
MFSNFGERVERSEACKRLSLNPECRYLLFFGLIREYKGLDILLEAFSKVSTENLRLIVAGEFYESKEKYEPLFNALGDRVILHDRFISDEDVKSMEKIIEACEKNNQKFRFSLENGWYTASFFFATGCKSDWSMNDKNEFVSVDDTFNSPEGIIAMKGMQKLVKSTAYDMDAETFADAGAIVTGIWNATTAQEHFGENFAAAPLPSFEVDGKSYHLGSFSGYKLMGVKPQTDAKKGAALAKLAQFLTNEECQLERYNKFQWGPSNKAAQSSDTVKGNVSLNALNEQNAFAVPQGQIHGAWWDIVKVLGADAKVATTDDELQSALNAYKAAVDKLFASTK